MTDSISSISSQLQEQLKACSISAKALEDAKLSLAPLEQKADEDQQLANRLMDSFRKLSGGTGSSLSIPKKRKLAPYNITPESKIARSGKAAYTRAINGGKSEADANKAKRNAEKMTTEKLKGKAADA